MIPDQSVTLFAALFRGNPTAHYVRWADRKPAYEAVEHGITPEDVARHLRGEEPSLLSIPILPTGRSYFGAVDVDRHDETDPPVDHAALARQVTELHLPLVVCRSKNGRGAWLWIFFKEGDGLPAASVRQLLARYVKILGLEANDKQAGTVEIFPKQDTLSEGQKGNGINLPYFGADRPAFGADGTELTLAGFLDIAAERASFGAVLAARDLTAGPVVVTKPEADRALTVTTIRELHQRNLDTLRKAAPGNRNVTLNTTCFFAGRAFAAQALDGTEELIKEEIRRIGRELGMSPHEFDATAYSGWSSGAKQPLIILDEQAAHDQALARVNSWLDDPNAVLPTAEDAIRDLALLDPLEYDEKRRRIAKRLDIRPSALDMYVRRARVAESTDELQGQVVEFTEIEPWAEVVDGLKLLDELSTLFKRHIYFPHPIDADALALWVVITHCRDAFEILPYIGVTSPTKECGKTTLLKILQSLVYRPIMASNISPAVVFRVVDLFKPTLLVDELDTFLEKSSEFIGILNSGHDKEAAFVYRCVGDNQDVRQFCTWGPKAYGMIGTPAGTLGSRSISVRLLRKKTDELVETFDKKKQAADLERLRRQLTRWAADHVTVLPAVTFGETTLGNRQRDNWKPLLTVAHVAGKTWFDRALIAAGGAAKEDGAEEDVRQELIRDIRNVFHTRKVDKLPSELLVLDLTLQKDSPWARYDHGQEISQHQMSRLLRDMGVRPYKQRCDKQLPLLLGRSPVDNLLRGYHRDQFDDLFQRFLAGEEPEIVPVARAEILS